MRMYSVRLLLCLLAINMLNGSGHAIVSTKDSSVVEKQEQEDKNVIAKAYDFLCKHKGKIAAVVGIVTTAGVFCYYNGNYSSLKKTNNSAESGKNDNNILSDMKQMVKDVKSAQTMQEAMDSRSKRTWALSEFKENNKPDLYVKTDEKGRDKCKENDSYRKVQALEREAEQIILVKQTLAIADNIKDNLPKLNYDIERFRKNAPKIVNANDDEKLAIRLKKIDDDVRRTITNLVFQEEPSQIKKEKKKRRRTM
jgi:hypothetical protein